MTATTAMANVRKEHRPDLVRKNCQKFLASLEKYRALLERYDLLIFEHRSKPEKSEEIKLWVLPKAQSVWAKLNEYGRQLLAAGKAWKMTVWIETHRQYLRVETAGFFEVDSDSDALPTDRPAVSNVMARFLSTHSVDYRAWGIDLQQTISWCETTKLPFGFSDYDAERDSGMQESVIRDLDRDVSALFAAANERSFGNDGQVVSPPLTPRERAVLDIIPLSGKGTIIGKKILDKLIFGLKNPACRSLTQSALTKDIIPKLKTYFGVRNDRNGLGYYRIPPMEAINSKK